jgi:hypothetical protein
MAKSHLPTHRQFGRWEKAKNDPLKLARPRRKDRITPRLATVLYKQSMDFALKIREKQSQLIPEKFGSAWSAL